MKGCQRCHQSVQRVLHKDEFCLLVVCHLKLDLSRFRSCPLAVCHLKMDISRFRSFAWQHIITRISSMPNRCIMSSEYGPSRCRIGHETGFARSHTVKNETYAWCLESISHCPCPLLISADTACSRKSDVHDPEPRKNSLELIVVTQVHFYSPKQFWK